MRVNAWEIYSECKRVDRSSEYDHGFVDSEGDVLCVMTEEEIHDFCMEYLIDGFEDFHYEDYELFKRSKIKDFISFDKEGWAKAVIEEGGYENVLPSYDGEIEYVTAGGVTFGIWQT